GCNEDDVGICAKPIHLDQDLVERLFALVVRAAKTCATIATHRVNFIDENDTGAVALGLFKEVAHAACTNTDEHLDKLRARDAKEGHTSLTGDGFCHQGLAGSRRANQQHTLGNARTQSSKLLRFLEELDNFLQLLLGFIRTSDIGKGHGRLVTCEESGAALAKGKGLVVATLALAEENKEETSNK